MQATALNVGLVPLARTTFDIALAEEITAQVRAQLEPDDFSLLGPEGLVTSLEEARAVARRQIRIFCKDYPVVVPSGSCAGMMKHHYPELFTDDPDLDRVKEFSARIFELSEFLVHVLKINLEDCGGPVKVAWHSSCHALREMQVTEDSKSLIRQLNNVELIELQHEEECCGFGGTFSLKYPEISEAIVQDKTRDVTQTGASRLLTGDCGCLMNITGALDYQNIKIRGQHLAEFLWERIQFK